MSEKGNNRPPWEKARNFIPGKLNKYGDYQPLPRSEQWGEMMYMEELAQKGRKEAETVARIESWIAQTNFGENDAAIKAQLRRIYELDNASKRAAYTRNVANPSEGDFKRDDSGKLFRYTTRYWKKVEPSAANFNAGKASSAPERVADPAVGDYKKIKGKVFRWTDEPAWLQVDRKTNYNIDLGETFERYNTLGKPYMNARDQLWQMLYPDEEPIYRPARYRRRNTRRRKSNRRNANTRKY